MRIILLARNLDQNLLVRTMSRSTFGKSGAKTSVSTFGKSYNEVRAKTSVSTFGKSFHYGEVRAKTSGCTFYNEVRKSFHYGEVRAKYFALFITK